MASESGGWLNRVRVILGGGCVCGVVGLVCFLPSAGGGHVIVLGVEHLGMGDQSA